MKSIRSPDQRELAKLLRRYRETARPRPLTQEELAEKLGFKDYRVVERIELGDVEPAATFVRQWCKKCGRSSRELWLTWEKNCKRQSVP